jgi:1-acyl-sn-glycerol-3-phosphate acyltransferase
MTSETPDYASQFPYPRRRGIRFVLRSGIRLGLALLCKLRILGEENLPSGGPLLVVANHFHFLDPPAVIRALPWPMEFFSGLRLPNAPASVKIFPTLWGAYRVRRGGTSRTAMRAANACLAQNGVFCVMPEGGSWADVLRPARPGAAYLAVQSGVPILPIGLDGLVDLFPTLRRRHRATVTVRIGRPFGPVRAEGRGEERRRQLDEIGHEIMRRIAELIPPERRGVYSDDPAIRAAAQQAAVWPYDDLMG